MVLAYYVRAIREGIQLAGVKTNFLLLSGRNFYANFPLCGGVKLFSGLYKRALPSAFRKDLCAKTGLNERDRKALNLPPEPNPIVLSTKERMLKCFRGFLKDYVKEDFLEYLEQLRPREFGKVLTVFAFHEAAHRKYSLKDAFDMLEKLGFYYDVDPTVVSELPVIAEELKLGKRRSDLKPYVMATLNGMLDPSYVLAYKLARELIVL
jgi:hypothetical protein